MSKKVNENIEDRNFIIRELRALMDSNPEYSFCEIIYSVLRLLPEGVKPKLTGLVNVSNKDFYNHIKKAIEEEKEILETK